MEKTLEILVVEDKEKHLEDAKKYFELAVGLGAANVTYATTLKEAQDLMKEQKYDGVICDIFFPTGIVGEGHQELIDELYEKLYDETLSYRQSEPMEKWKAGKIEAPCGVYVVEECMEKKIPVVFNTDTYHHGLATEPVNRWAREKRQGMIESGSPDSEGSTKLWEEAYATIVQEILGEFINLKSLDRNIQSGEEELERIAAGKSSYDANKVRSLLEKNKKQRENALVISKKYGISKESLEKK